LNYDNQFAHRTPEVTRRRNFGTTVIEVGYSRLAVRLTDVTSSSAVQDCPQAGPRQSKVQFRDLMIRYQQGDAAAVETLVTSLSPVLLRFCSGPGMSRSDVEDLLQDCWLRIHRARHSYLPSEPLLPWIFAVARFTRLDAYRRRSRLGSREVPIGLTPETAGAAPPQGNGVMELVNRLPDGQREVILMLKVEGMSLEEAAQATSSTAGAIKQKAHRAYAALRDMLADDGPSRRG